MVLGLSTFLPQTIWIRRAAAINAIAYILVACAWWPAWTGEHVQGFGTWLANIPGVAGLAAAAAWQPAWALLYLGVGVTLVQLINHAIREAPLFYLLIPDLSAALMFCTVFVAASVVALRTGQTLDATIASTHAAAAGAAAAAAKRRRTRTLQRPDPRHRDVDLVGCCTNGLRLHRRRAVTAHTGPPGPSSFGSRDRRAIGPGCGSCSTPFGSLGSR